MASVRRTSVILVALLVTAVGAAAGRRAHADGGQPTARLAADPPDPFVGEIFTVTLLVDRCDQVPDVEPSRTDGLVFSGPVGGRPQRAGRNGSWCFIYHFLATRPGQLSVGPFAVQAGTSRFVAPAISVTARAAHQTDECRLEMSLSESTCVVGQPLVLSVRWLVALPLSTVKAVDLQLPVLRDSRFDIRDPHEEPPAETEQLVGVPVSGTRVLARLSTVSRDDRHWSQLAFRKILVPRVCGSLSVPAASVFCTVVSDSVRSYRQWNQYPAYFDNDFFNHDVQGPRRRVFASSAQLPLAVKALPEAGRPAGFRGLIGRYQLDVAAQPRRVPVGAPVALTLRVRGSGPLEAVDLPPLDQLPPGDWRTTGPPEPGQIESGAKVFHRIVRPLHTAIKQIPPIELAWFDPKEGRYGVSRSKPISLTVVPGRAIGLQASRGAGSQPEQFSAGSNNSSSGAHKWITFLLWGAVVLLVTAVSGAGAMALRSRRRRPGPPASSRAHSPLAAFCQKLDQLRRHPPPNASDQWRLLYDALRGYFAQRMNLRPGAVTFFDVQRWLGAETAEQQTIDTLRQLFATCDACRFAGHVPAETELQRALDQAAASVAAVDAALPAASHCRDPSLRSG